MKFILIVLVSMFIFGKDGVNANAPPPAQGFFLVTKKPERERTDSTDIFIYAINTGTTAAEDVIQFNTDGSSVDNTGMISENGQVFGSFLQVRRPRTSRGDRFGRYQATYTPAAGDVVEMETFVKQKSKILNTQGVYSLTIYPAAVGSSTLSGDSPTCIGVAARPGNSLRIKWIKDNDKKTVTMGPQRDIKSIEDAGLYTARRRGRAGRGWSVQVRVIAANCPIERWWDGTACQARVQTCQNGGVVMNSADGCTCPPFLVGDTCSDVVDLDPADNGPFVLSIHADGVNPNVYLQCKHLEDGHPECRTNLVCLGDLYGCRCSPGWTGNRCNKECPPGRWGVDCSQTCPAEQPGCNPFFGPNARI